MTDTLAAIANVAIITFVLSSMVALGLSLTVKQIIQPLANVRLILFGLAPEWCRESVAHRDSTAVITNLTMSTPYKRGCRPARISWQVSIVNPGWLTGAFDERST